MEIQRYISKNKAKVDYFGEHYIEHRWDYDWYIGDDKIGVRSNSSTESESFIRGILVADDELIISPIPHKPTIQRANISYGTMRGSDGGLNEINKLIKLLQDNDTIHMCLSSSKPKGLAEILTFTSTEPSKAFYKEGKVLPVSLSS